MKAHAIFFMLFIIVYQTSAHSKSDFEEVQIKYQQLGDFNNYNTEVFKAEKIQAKSKLVGSCTLRIDVTLDDGTIVKGKVTFYDVSFIQCIGLKIANLFL